MKVEQGLIYCWRAVDSTENVCKIGKSTVGKFYHSVVTAATRWHLHGIDILGFEILENETEALIRERELLDKFGRINKTEFVYLSEDVLEWLENCCDNSEETFLELYEKYRERDNKRNRDKRSNPNYKDEERIRHTLREKERRENNPEYREYLNANARAHKKRKRLEVDENQLTLFD